MVEEYQSARILPDVYQLDEFERINNERRIRTGRSVQGKKTHEEYAKEVVSITDDALAIHSNPGSIRYTVGFSIGKPSITVVAVRHNPPGVVISKAAYLNEFENIKEARDLIRAELAKRSGTEIEYGIGMPGDVVPENIWPHPSKEIRHLLGGKGKWTYSTYADAVAYPTHMDDTLHEEHNKNRFFHGTSDAFDSDEIGTDDKQKRGVFFSPSMQIAGTYAGAAIVESGDSRPSTVPHWERLPESSRILATDIDTEGFVKFSEADAWLRARGVHPADDPEIVEKIKNYPAEVDVEEDEDEDESFSRPGDPFWERYDSARAAGEFGEDAIPVHDPWWGASADAVVHHGAPGMMFPNSLKDYVTRHDPEGEEVAVHDLDRIKSIGEIRPRYIVADAAVRKHVSPIREKAEIELGEDCEDEITELYEAIRDVRDPGRNLAAEDARLIEARGNIEECAEELGIAGEWEASTRSVGGDPTFSEIQSRISKYPMDMETVSEFRSRLLGESAPVPPLERSALAREALSEAVETGYIAPRSDVDFSSLRTDQGELRKGESLKKAIQEYKTDRKAMALDRAAEYRGQRPERGYRARSGRGQVRY